MKFALPALDVQHAFEGHGSPSNGDALRRAIRQNHCARIERHRHRFDTESRSAGDAEEDAMMLGTEDEVRCSGQVVDAAIKVHRALGPGLFERVYAECLAEELHDRGLEVLTELELPIVYRGRRLAGAYRIDMLVARQVVVEVKTVRFFAPIHAAQLLTYLKLSGFRIGLLLNFNSVLMKDGVLRRFNFRSDRDEPGDQPLRVSRAP